MLRTALLVAVIALEWGCASRPASPDDKAFQDSLAKLEDLVEIGAFPCADHSDCYCQSFESKSAALPLRYASSRYCPSTMRGKTAVQFESFDSRGNLVDRGQFLEGLKEGEWVSLRSDRSLAARTVFVSGCEEGETLAWYEGGSLEWRQTFDRGVPSGSWEHHLKTGEIDRVLDWREGKLLRVQRRADDGILHDRPIKPEDQTIWNCIGGKSPTH